MTAHPDLIDRRSLLKGAGALAMAAAAGPAFGQQSDSLDAIARRKGLRFGTAVAGDHLAQRDFAALVSAECSVLVAENAFKWKHLEPRQGRYRFGEADTIAAFAQTNNMLLRGHTLCWNQDNRIPDWQLQSEAELGRNGGARMAALLEAHAQLLARRYPGVASWDAVNEAVQLSDGQLRNALLTRTLGERFIDIAFAAMRAAAPQAQMVYNDYMSWDAKPDHRNGVLRMLEAALGRGVRIDALGIQSHIGGTLDRRRDELAWRRFLERVEGMGLDILITELDCSDRNVRAADVATRDAETAAFVRGYLDLTLSFRRVRQVVLWGISDRDSYLNRPGYGAERRRPDGLPMRGHPYDTELRPRPMRAAIAASLESAPLRA